MQEDQTFEKPAVEATGGGWFGDGLFSVSGTWPFMKIKLYESEIFIRIFSKKVHFPYIEINKIIFVDNWIFSWIMGCGFRFCCEDRKYPGQYPSLLVIWVWPKSAKKIREYLEEKSPGLIQKKYFIWW